VLLIREMLPFMARGSHIVNIGSMGGVQGSVKFPRAFTLQCFKGSAGINE
jgi:NAD(P)-dependent dehydrogenase (short-subunit alcohol dehydrogenase family)